MCVYYVWFLFFEVVLLGVFMVLDLFLFYVFFDLSLVGMYFLIGCWGYDDVLCVVFKFFVYMFVGLLVILLVILGLFFGSGLLIFDMCELIVW